MKAVIQDRDGTFVTMDVWGDGGPVPDGGYARLTCGAIAEESAKAGYPPYLWYSMRTDDTMHVVPLDKQSALENVYQQLIEMEMQ